MRLLALVTLAGVCGLVLWAVGQPLFTDDLWWHLALGKAYLGEGPWLAADPLLFTAPGPPAPAAWLADAVWAGVDHVAGFTGLRLLHLVLVGIALALLGSILLRASGSGWIAVGGTTAFAALAAYRLVQLRPHLFSLLALLLLYRCLFESERPPGWRRIAATGILMAFWVNLHSAFVLGPATLALAIGILALRWVAERRGRGRALGLAPGNGEVAPLGQRLRGLWAALGAGLVGTLANPAGIHAYAPYLRAGASTPSLGRVGDEWVGLRPLQWPAGLQPSAFVWGLEWLLLIGVGLIAIAWIARRGLREGPRVRLLDLALAGMSFFFVTMAVRFVWLGFLPLIVWARASRGWAPSSGVRAAALLAGSIALAVGFVQWGDWRAISGFLPSSLRDYARPYPSTKYHAHAVWLMQDAELEGHLFNEYYMGGFLGYWLSPGIQTFVNGSLNVSQEAMEANWPLRHRRGVREGETFLEALDRLDVDLFMGIRTPSVAPEGHPWVFTSGHLEGSPGWTLAFRNLMTSLYVRDGPVGRRNLARLDDYYRDNRVPFDPSVGFEPARVVEGAPRWARRHGVVPVDYPELARVTRSGSPLQRALGLDRLASIESLLREHERAIALDRELLAEAPGAHLARRRLAWNLLQRGRDEAALAVAEEAGHRGQDPLLEQIAGLARDLDALDPEERAARLATQPFLGRGEVSRALSGFLRPPARSQRD